jgi:bacteriocin biosynthesis cyclodehydratase domain-containing protein
MPDGRTVLLVRSGSVGVEAEALLAQAVPTTAIDVEAFSSVDSFSTVALVTDRPYPAVAERIDELCFAARIPWSEATLVAHEYRIGPIIRPAFTPCHRCWSRRMASQADDAQLTQLIDSVGQATSGAWFRGELRALNRQVAAMAAAEVLSLHEHTSVRDPLGMGRFWLGDAVYGQFSAHRYYRVGRCSRCSTETPGGVDSLADAVRCVLQR